jgi:inositol-phosphate phosphatase/L-galactose 1-phosphate phosphatase/histidinol-phosphatase
MNSFETKIETCVTFATELANCARSLLVDFENAPMDVELKPDRSFVTAMDARIETALRQMISTRWPEHGIIGEEEEWHDPEAEWVWVLDPIDGTAAFIAGLPVYGTLIALAYRGVPVIGIIDIPKLDLRWHGVAGQGTTLNGKKCNVQAPETLASSIMSTSNPDFYAENERPALQAMRDATSWRIYGGAALSYGRLAEGRVHLSMDSGLQIYDFAPFRPIIEGAGGIITDWSGAPITLASGPRILAAADAQQHQTALSLIANS